MSENNEENEKDPVSNEHESEATESEATESDEATEAHAEVAASDEAADEDAGSDEHEDEAPVAAQGGEVPVPFKPSAAPPPKDGPLYGVLAEYDSPGALIEACKEVRDAGFTKWDSYSPFPVHGIDPAMGIKRTVLPWIVLGGGLTGLFGGLLLQWWANAYHWPWVVSGKPFFSLPANIPITFETTVLFAGLTCFFAMWTLNKLPKPWHPLFRNERFLRVTDDAFFIGVEAEDPAFDHEKTTAMLRDAGAVAVEDCHIDPDPAKKSIPRPLIAFVIISTIAALVPFALIAKARASKSSKPHWHIIPDMDFQPKAKAQSASDFFEDRRSMRLPVEGTVAHGELQEDDHFFKGVVYEREEVLEPNAAGEVIPQLIDVPKWATTFPQNDQFQVDARSMARGKDRFDIYCQPCHGESGDGQGMIAKRAREVPQQGWNAPSDVNVAIRQPHGQIFNSITNGVRQMPAYGAQISPADRWAIVLYVRALQRSQNSTIEDAPPDQQAQIRQ